MSGSAIPTDAIAFLAAVGGILVLLVVFFLYINKKMCFTNVGGFPCIDRPPAKSRSSSSKLGSAYAYDDADTSSDSDDEVLRRYQQSVQRVPSNRSIHSQRSGRSAASKTSKRSDDPRSAAERGPLSSPEISAIDDSDVEAAAAAGARQRSPVTSTPHVAPADDEKGSTVSSAAKKSRLDGAPSEGASYVSSHDPAVAQFQGQVEQHNEGFQHEEASPEHHSATSSEHGMSAFGDTASMSVGEVGDEHLFDVSDLQDREPALISKCGTLEVVFNYSAIKAKMTVKVGVARDIPTKERGGASNVQVRLLLLPTKKTRHKTKIKPGETPEFNETFDFKVPPEEVNNMGLRVRLYGTERMRRERMIGESVVGFASVNQDTETTHWLTLEPRSNLSGGDSKLDLSSLSRSDSASSTQSMQHGGMPELLIGLAYNGTTGRLSVEVIKGSNFRNMAMNRAPDTYVKLTLMSPNGQEIARSKTSIRRGQPNPLYKETFMFQVALFQLPDVTLMTSVYNKRSMKRKEMIGWFSLGLNNSGEEELGHWNDMRESKGEQVCRWHVLLES